MSADVIAFPEREPEPEFVAGPCTRCQQHTDHGVLLVVDQDSAAGGRIVCCADIRECDQRRSLRALGR